MQRWLARFSFSFMILAAVLGWQGYKLITEPGGMQSTRGMIYCIAAGALAALAGAGVRARHSDKY